ncbi:MAG: GspE/PulE family protein [Gemmatimonadaceae bacterium]
MANASANTATHSAPDTDANNDVGTDGRDLRAAASGELALRFPARWLEEHTVLPLEVNADGTVSVATAGNVDSTVLDALQRTFSAAVRFVNVSAAELRAALVATERSSASATDSHELADDSDALDDLRAMASREPVVQVVNAMLSEALQARASDVHVESVANGLRVRFRLDGVLRDAQLLGKPFQAAVLSRLKVLAGLDIAERRLPQDGRARVRVADRDVDVRVSTLPALHGESIVLRLLDQGTTARTLPDLGIAGDIRRRLDLLLARTSGLVLVTGPTGSGKTTTLYAALAARSVPGVKVVTVEDPVEYRMEGITQLPVNTKAGFGFANALRAILRHDPDVILVGEMRDTETAEIAVQAALTGHLVLSTLHTTDAPSAVARLTEMGIAPYLVAATLQGVLAQRLVRTLCENCATWSVPTTAENALLGAAASHISKVRHAVGCVVCANTGFRGRAAIAELLTLNDALRAQIVAAAPLDTLRAAARAQGLQPLREDGWRLVAEGRTTVDEVVRVVSEDESA